MISALSDGEKVAVFREIQKAWETKDWRAVVNCMAEDCVFESLLREPVVGREKFHQSIVGTDKPNKEVRIDLLRIGVVDGALITERLDVITIDGITRSFPVIGVMEFKGSLVSRWREYTDSILVRRARGEEV